jgi:hypothetical protein
MTFFPVLLRVKTVIQESQVGTGMTDQLVLPVHQDEMVALDKTENRESQAHRDHLGLLWRYVKKEMRLTHTLFIQVKKEIIGQNNGMYVERNLDCKRITK